MALIASLSRLSLAACAVALLLSPAEAAETRYVASNGVNNDNCTLNQPCRTLQRGVNRTPDGGELIVLNSGNYGNSLTINRSITISADGVTATLVNPGGITIDDADAVVVLRGLHLKGTGASGQYGVFTRAAAAVHIEQCTIELFSNGIRLFGSAAANARLFITDSIVRDSTATGLYFSGGASLVVENSRFENNGGNGVRMSGEQATITRSVSSGNGSSGVQQVGGRMNVTWTTVTQNGANGFIVSGNGQVTLESSMAGGNAAAGLRLVTAGSRARVSRSVFTENNVGISNAGRVQTFQNNILLNNNTNLQNSGNITTPAPF